MNVLIKGMEMPKACVFCELYDGELYWCRGAKKEVHYSPEDKRAKFCPLVQLPPHGDLIDRNALPWEKQGKMLTDPDEWGIDARDIEAAPIIIPADPAEEAE